tara:strand:- start:143 stop:361 length:219 start_codon:yes stop_codon:yes gene_type:complete
MDLLEKTLQHNYDWAIHRMNVLCKLGTIEDIEDAESIRGEFKEWIHPIGDDHDILALESLSDLYYDGEDVFG